MPLRAPVVCHTVVGISVVVVVGTTSFISFLLQILAGDSFVEEIHTLTVVAGVEGLAVAASLRAVVLPVAAALVPVPFLVHGALAELASTAGPLTRWTLAPSYGGLEIFEHQIVRELRYAFAELRWVEFEASLALCLALLDQLASFFRWWIILFVESLAALGIRLLCCNILS